MTMIRDYNALVDGLNEMQQRIVECENAMKTAKTPEDVVYLIRRKKTLKHMQDLLFCPERAQAFIQKHEELDMALTTDLQKANFSGKACSSQIAKANPSL